MYFNTHFNGLSELKARRIYCLEYYSFSQYNSLLKHLYLREIVILVEDVYNLGKEVVCEVVELEEMVMEVEVTHNHAERWILLIIGITVMPFWEKMK